MTPIPASWWAVVACVLGMTILLLPLVRLHARRFDLKDPPGPRRSHEQPTLRGGGLACVLGLTVGLVLLPLPWAWQVGLVSSFLAVALLGMADDHRPLPALLRLMLQMLIALWFLGWLGGVSTLELAGAEIQAPWLWNPLALLGLVWLINLHNFMDGSDGLAAAQGVWSGLFLALAFTMSAFPLGAAIALCLAAAWLAFLPWNLSRPGFFMGDVGSMGLGFMLGALVLLGLVSGTVSLGVAFLAVSVFSVDATATLVNRMFTRPRWYTPHREHAYQRLIALGASHGRVCFLYAVVNWALVFPALLAALVWPVLSKPLALAVALVLLVGWLYVQGVARKTIKGTT